MVAFSDCPWKCCAFSGSCCGCCKGIGLMSEKVNHPHHYGGDTVYEVIKVLEAWLTPEQFIGFCRGNAIKYSARADRKGAPAEDMAKAEFYAQYEIDYRKRLGLGKTGEKRVHDLIILGSHIDHDIDDLS